MLFIDTNIFVEYFLKQEKDSQVRTFLFQSVEKGRPIVCSHYSIHSIEAIFWRRKCFDQLENFLEFIQQLPNLHMVQTSIQEERVICAIAREKKLDFDDALQYYVAKANDCDAIVSFDTHFDKLDLERKEPADFL